MELVSPNVGLIFWMTLSFFLLLLILRRYAWKPIMKSLNDRENRIEDALNEANKAREEMQQLKFSNEQMLREAKEERDAILREARKIKDAMLEDARLKAADEADRIIMNARENIHYEKMQAITELKNQIAVLSIDIAEKLLQSELSNDEKQKQLMDKLLGKINFN